MALGKELGEFSFKITSTAFSKDGTVSLNVDGTATGYGTVLGSLILTGEPGATSGAASWVGEGFLDDGTVLGGAGEGTFEELGGHQWRTRLIITITNGDTIASDGRIDLASRSFTGRNLEWD